MLLGPSHLGKIKLEFFPPERRLVQFYPGAGCGFGVTEVDSYTSEALKLLECHTFIVREKKRFEHFL